MKTVCVLGGSGFVGRHLLEALTEQDSVNVKILSKTKSWPLSLPNQFQVVIGDLMIPKTLIDFFVPGSTTINLVYSNTESGNTNIIAIKNLINACKSGGVKRLIHCSTADVAGCVREDVITEETVCAPKTEYEMTKLKIETILTEGLKDFCDMAIVRPTTVFGEGGKNLLKMAYDLVGKCRLSNLLKTTLFASRRLNLVNVENVVAAILFLAFYPARIPGSCYIVSDDDAAENNYYDVARMLSYHLGLPSINKFKIPFQQSILSAVLRLLGRSNINPNRVYSQQKLIRLGYNKTVDFPEAIRKFAVWYQPISTRRSGVV